MSNPANSSFSIGNCPTHPVVPLSFFRKRALRFFSLSLLVHLAGMLALGHSEWFDYGLKDHRAIQGDMPAISVSVALESRPEPENMTGKADNANDGEEEPAKPADAPSPIAASERKPSNLPADEKTTGPNSPDSAVKAIPRNRGYYPVGSLTRLPAPLEPIDLNVSPINNRAAAGPIQITLYIDASGNVSDIDGPDRDEKTRELYELVASRFRQAHFSPGEVDGRKVNSRITITVMSEPA